ncbi:MAG TPA: transcription antitermination factor NusB [Vicinamibacteria bacterium]|nr:transcription antitermination factor NusB [Vicinamibacteria bacterium]
MGKRTKARECALQMLYQWDVTREPMDRVAGLFWQVRTSTDETRAMAERLARGAQGDVARLDEEITRASKNWRFDRIAAIDKNILRLGVYELLREPGTPSSVVIDEAVELAKRFSEVDSPPFVNGVLDAIKARVRGEPAGEAGASRARTRPKKEKGETHE